MKKFIKALLEGLCITEPILERGPKVTRIPKAKSEKDRCVCKHIHIEFKSDGVVW